MNLIKLTFLMISMSLIVACNQQAPSNSVAVLDLVKVSDETGNAEKIQSELAKIRGRLQQDLQSVQMNLQKNFQDNQAKIGKTPTEEQRAQLGQMLADAQNKLKFAQNSAATELKNKREELVIKLRETVRPVANRIAHEKGMTVILIKNENLILGYDEKADITEAVIAELKKAGGDEKKPAPEKAESTTTEKPVIDTPAAEAEAPAK